MPDRFEGVKQIVSTVLFAEPASKHSSLGVGGNFSCMAFPATEEELIRLLIFVRNEGFPFHIVGNLTNTIVADAGVDGVVISLKGMAGITVEESDDAGQTLFIRAGTPLRDLVSWCANEGLTGAEFCTGIPGIFGGAVVMNAGAFGGEIKDIIVKVRLLNAAGLLAEIPRERLFFGYRSFSAGEYSIVLGATIRVHKGDSETIKREIARIVLLRREKHPLEFRNAGSVFKNTNGIVVGRLVEELGLKGTRIGDAQISPKHGNFIVNLGKASANDVVALMELVKEKARRCEGIELEAEVKLMGF